MMEFASDFVGFTDSNMIEGQSMQGIPYVIDLRRDNYSGSWSVSYPGDVTIKRVTFGDLKAALGYPKAAITNCKNCAAPLNWFKQSCEYCGTFFQ